MSRATQANCLNNIQTTFKCNSNHLKTSETSFPPDTAVWYCVCGDVCRGGVGGSDACSISMNGRGKKSMFLTTARVLCRLVAGHGAEPPGGSPVNMCDASMNCFSLCRPTNRRLSITSTAPYIVDKSHTTTTRISRRRVTTTVSSPATSTKCCKWNSVVCDFNNYPYIAKTYAGK